MTLTGEWAPMRRFLSNYFDLLLHFINHEKILHKSYSTTPYMHTIWWNRRTNPFWYLSYWTSAEFCCFFMVLRISGEISHKIVDWLCSRFSWNCLRQMHCKQESSFDLPNTSLACQTILMKVNVTFQLWKVECVLLSYVLYYFCIFLHVFFCFFVHIYVVTARYIIDK